jgi:glycosyltransferase involved in cell wall biosynthesis
MTNDRRRHIVAQVTPFYPPHVGGVENVAQALAELLAKRHDVEVITTTCGSDGAPTREHTKGMRVRRFRGWELAHTPFSPGLALRLLLLHRRAIVHAHVAQAFLPEVLWLTSVLRRRPYIIHFHLDVDPSGRFGVLLPTYKRLVLGPVLRRAAAVIALSQGQASFLAKHYRVRPARVTVVPNGVGSSFYRRLHETSRTSSGPLRLLFVGRLDAQKNVLRLLDAISYVSSPVDLVLVGDGEQRGLVRDHLERLDLSNVRLAGAQRGEGLLRWYRWADVLVLPSDKEGMPLVLLEAMAAGLAIISTDVPGSREVLEGVGLLTAPHPGALGAAIQRVAADPHLRSELAARSLQRGRSHCWDERVVELERIYDQVAESSWL